MSLHRSAWKYELEIEELTVCVAAISSALKIVSAHQKQIHDKHKRRERGKTSKTLDRLEAEYRVQCMEIRTKLKHMETLFEACVPASNHSCETSATRDCPCEKTTWRDALQKAEADRDISLAMFNSSKEHVESLSQQNESLMMEKAKLNQRLSERESVTARPLRNYRQHEAEKVHDSTRLKQRLSELENENARLLRNYNQEKAEKDNSSARLKQRLSELESENARLLRNYRQETAEKARLKERLSELDSENARLLRNFSQEKEEKDGVLTRLSAVAGKFNRDNYPNIADLSDLNRPTKIAEKMSELYENEWTDSFVSLKKSHSDLDVICWKLVNILKNINEQCHEMAWQDFFPRVQSAIELPAKVLQEFKPSLRPDYKIVLTKEMQQQIKKFRKLRAPTFLPSIQRILVPKDFDSDELRAYYNKCVEVCWLAAVQDPPLFMNFIPGEMFDTTLFNDYNARGPYVEFLVWPALHLHQDGPLLRKGVAQGIQQSRGVQGYTTHDSVGGRRAAYRPVSPSVVVVSSKIRDSNPNIADLRDVNRPTKIAEKMSELYDNEWTDTFDSLEKSDPEMDVVKTLLDVLNNINTQCCEMAWQDFFLHVQNAIVLPAKVFQKSKAATYSEDTVFLTREMQQQIKEFRRFRAPSILPLIQSELVPKDVDTDVRAYYNKCVEVCWLAAVQDPPLFMNFNIGEKFDTTLFNIYTARGPFVEFLVWPALHLHDKGPLLSKGVAQGTAKHPVSQEHELNTKFKEQSSSRQLQCSQPQIKDASRSFRVPKKARKIPRQQTI